MNTADKGLQNDLYREVAPKKKKPGPLPWIIVVIVLAVVVGFYLFSDKPTKAINMPEATAPAAKGGSAASSVIQPAPVATSATSEGAADTTSKARPRVKSTIQPRQNPGDSARKLIAGFRAKKGAANLKQAIESADRFQAKGMLTDAYLLYFFAARGGDNHAAQVLAKIHDPAYHSRQTSMLDQPDLVQAYKWYRQAARGGQAAVQNDLNDFRARVEQMAANGNREAKQLSLQWQ